MATTDAQAQNRSRDGQLHQGRVIRPVVLPSAKLRKAMVTLLAMALCFLASKSFAVQAGDTLTNRAILHYDGISSPLQANVDVKVTSSSPTNVPPTDIQLSCETEPGCTGHYVYENAPGAVLGTLSAVDADQASGHTFTVVGDGRFVVSNGKLKLADGVSLDYEATPQVNLTVQVTDASGNTYRKTIVIEVRNVNEAPTNLVASSNYVPADTAGEKIGKLSVSDPDVGDTHTYKVVGDNRFAIVDGYLALAPTASLPANSDVPVTVMATDAGGLTTTSVVIVTTDPTHKVVAQTAATITLLAPDSNGSTYVVAPASCQPSTGVVATSGGSTGYVPTKVPGSLTLGQVGAYAIGDPVIVSVDDMDRNLSPVRKDTVSVTVTSNGANDTEGVVLTETGLDTGIFVGFIYTRTGSATQGDCALSVTPDSDVNVAYTDPGNTNDSVSAAAGIAPIGLAFDDVTGQPIDGVILTLVNADANGPAEVHGNGPAFARYPSALKTGETVRDAAGTAYAVGNGQYRFPAIPDGNYRLEVFNKAGYRISTKTDAALQSLGGVSGRNFTSTAGWPYSLGPASRGEIIHVSQGAFPRIDVPLRVVTKTETTASSSKIQFLQYSTMPGVGTPYDVQQSECVGGKSSQISDLRNTGIPVPGIVNLEPTDAIKAGEPLFVMVTDPDQNEDPTIRETVMIQLDVPSTNDREYLSLTETEPNSGVFIGYLQSNNLSTATVGSCGLEVVTDSQIRTTYTDAFNHTDSSESSVLVDPFGKVFSSFDGTGVNGVAITLINDDTGAPAEVFGDGPAFAPYPHTVVTGGSVTDDSGNQYDFPMGEYRFPYVLPGHYHLELADVPSDYVFPSAVPDADLQKLPDAPFELNSGSRGEQFIVPLGPAVHLDIPLDRRTGEVFITKQSSKQRAAIGDFVQFSVVVQNRSNNTLSKSEVSDTLPKGFRYRPGSLEIDGSKVTDPRVSDDGRTLLIDLPDLTDARQTVTYVTEVTAGAVQGNAVNTATVLGPLVTSSNTATATVFITDDLFKEKTILTGKVTLGKCGEEIKNPKGLSGVRLFLEDGTNVVTDQNGMWHIEGVTPGTHVVQLDTESLPARYEVAPCNKNSRFAGTAFSQFVDVQGGTVWRADFKVQEKPAPVSKVDLTQSLQMTANAIDVAVTAVNQGDVAINNADVIYMAPTGWHIQPGSEKLDGKATSYSDTVVGALWQVSKLEGEHKLEFALVPAPRPKPAAENKVFELRPRFETRRTVLTGDDSSDLDRIVAQLGQGHWDELTVVGYTDNVRIAPANRSEFKDNDALSKARAQAVADYLKQHINVPAIHVVGAGERYPIASNATAAGRKQNRRVEILAKAAPVVAADEITPDMLVGESNVRLRFSSAGNPDGKTGMNSLPLSHLIGGFDHISTSVEGSATGSWDLVSDAGTPLPPRDPNVQGLISIVDGSRVVSQTNAVKLDLDSRLTPRLTYDGKPVGNDRIGFKADDAKTGKSLYSYIGVDFGQPGDHVLHLQGVDGFGNVRYDETAHVVRVGELYKIDVGTSKGNVADGKTPVNLQLVLRDRRGEVIHANYKLGYDSDRLKAYKQDLSLSELSKIEDGNIVRVNMDGVARFSPVTQSGTYHVTLKYQDVQKQVDIFVPPEHRDWIMVGLAEGTAAYRLLSGNMKSLKDEGMGDEYDLEGRAAFYAKGEVKGSYILTAAYDSAKPSRTALAQQIDPNAYYTLYGDKTAVQYDASSQRKLYLKLEKNQFYALFGDFSTGLSVTELSNYSRRLNGLKTEYEGDKVKVNAFASQADQAFVKDEIRGDGTSGLYHLSSTGILANSDTVVIETRDRFHSQDIVDKKTMQRFVDYDIDYDKGTIFFKQPIYSQDDKFNPIFIVADYETQGDGKNRLNAGGRVAYKLKDNSEVGATVVREGVENRESTLTGVDLHYQVDEATDIKAEVARTHTNAAAGSTSGSAYLAEVSRQSEKVNGKAYIRQQGPGFGLGQQNKSESGTRKVGVEGKYHVNDAVNIQGEAWRQTDLSSSANEDVAQTTVNYRTDRYQANAGVRSARSETAVGSQTSNQVMAGGSYKMLGGKLDLSSNADAAIGGSNREGNFPKRLRVGLDYKLSKDVTLKAEQEFTWGDQQKSQGTRIGMTSNLWKGAEVSTQVEQKQQENTERLAAVTGLKQRWDVNNNLRLDFGLDRSHTMRSTNSLSGVPPLTVTTVYSSPNSDDFTSVTFGSKFKKDAWDWSTRVEYRSAASEDKFNLLSDVIRDLDEGQQLLAKVDYQHTTGSSSGRTSTDIQLGYSYRPVDSRWTVFNKLDLNHELQQNLAFDTLTQKIINNLNANYRLSDNTQVALQYAMKYVVDNFDNSQYHGFTDLYGVELRHDLNDKWDVGGQSSLYNSRGSGTSNQSYGLSVGYNVARNMWMSLGYNFTGFRDDDFTASEYTAKGVFLKYRIKFDQNSLRQQ